MKSKILTMGVFLLALAQLACSTKIVKRGIASPDERGKRIGNGGGACVCRDNGNITFAELLDFSEAKDKLQVDIANVPMSKDAIIEGKLKILEDLKFLHKSLKEELAVVQKIKQMTLDKETLPYTNDFITTVCSEKYGQNCKYEQAAIYFDNNNVLKVSSKITSKFDEKNLAGLDIHEAMYRLDRRFTNSLEITSEFTKKFVAMLFAENVNKVALNELIKNHFTQITNSNGENFPKLHPVKNNNNLWGFGYIDENGLIGDYKVNPIFTSVEEIKNSNKFYIARINKFEGIVNVENGYSINAKYRKILMPLPNDAFLVQDQNEYKIIDNNDRLISSSRKYSYIGMFSSDGFAIFRGLNIYGIIDIYGNEVYTTQNVLAEGSEIGLVPYKDKFTGLWGYINYKGENIIKAQFYFAGPFSSNGYARADFNNQKGYVTSLGEFKIFGDFFETYDFHDNIARVKIKSSTEEYYSFIKLNGKLKYNKFSKATDFRNGIAKVQFKNIGYDFNMNTEGEIENFDDGRFVIAQAMKDDSLSAIASNASWTNNFKTSIQSFQDDLSLFPIYAEEKTYSGENIVIGNYYTSNMNCPLYFYRKSTKYDFKYMRNDENKVLMAITPFGQLVEPKEFNKIEWCDDGFTKIQYKDGYRGVDRNLNFITPKLKFIGKNTSGLLVFQNEKNKFGFMNRDGLVVIDPVFDSASDFSNGTAIVTTVLNGRKAVINKKGVILKYLE